MPPAAKPMAQEGNQRPLRYVRAGEAPDSGHILAFIEITGISSAGSGGARVHPIQR